MTKRLQVLLAVCLLASTAALAQAADDDAAIKEVVDRGYVQGVHIDADAAKMRSGMHDSFIMFVRNGDKVSALTRDAWIERIEAGKAQPKPEKKPETRADIDVLDRSVDTAVVRVKLYRDGKQIFTDYISLYRFPDGWKMVGKVFQRH